MEDSATRGLPIGGLSSEDRNLSVLAHLGGFFATFIFPFGNVLAPLIVWLLKRESSPFVEEHAREAINFQITMTIACLIAGALVFLLIGFLILPVLVIADLILAILAAMQASRGEHYRYPFTLRLLT
jgi:uncharacterized protein